MVGLITGIISVLIFSIVNNKIKYSEKVALKIRKHVKSRLGRVLIYLIMIILFSIIIATAEWLVTDISENERLAEIVRGALFGALMTLFTGYVQSNNVSE